jgi:hypothetical protein
MLPEAKSGDLLYVSGLSGHARAVKILSYPEGKSVGKLTGFGIAAGLCSDSGGDVFVVDAGNDKIIEYAHGGAAAINTLNTPTGLNGCSVDPTTGNLAAAGTYLGGGKPSVVVYPRSGSTFGTPTTYSDPQAKEFAWCSYDGSGNLFANGSTETGRSGVSVLDELPQGQNALVNISVGRSLTGDGAVQWDGTYLAIASPSSGKTLTIYQLQIASSTAKIVNTIKLRSAAQYVQFWVQASNIVSPENGVDVGVWAYPAGGSPTTSAHGLHEKIGVTVSVAP